MNRPIKYEDIKVGDQIRITREIEVSRIYENQDFLRDVQGPYARTFFTKGANLELVSRPLPNLPTEPGSVVKVTSGAGSAVWMLNTAGYWNSHHGGQKSIIGFKAWLESEGHGVEVIA